MTEEDKEWLRSMLHRSIMAHKLKVNSVFTEAERRRWERLYCQAKDEYEQVIREMKVKEGLGYEQRGQ